MKVQMRAQISGTRNGEDWPGPGAIVDLPDDEAESLILNGLALEPDEETADEPIGDVETATKKPRGKAAPATAPQA